MNVDCQNFIPYTIKASHLTNDHSRMVEIIGIRNYAPFHDPMPGHQLNILWQNAVSDLCLFHHQQVNISLGSILERFIPQSKVDHSEIWSFVKCGFLPSSCISQFANTEIICKLRIEDIGHYYTPHTTKLLGGILVSLRPSVSPSICPSVRPASRVRSVASTVQDGFFPYLVQMINSMRGCVANDDLWPWPISSRSFGLDLENRVRSVASTVLDGFFLYLAHMITIIRGCVAC